MTSPGSRPRRGFLASISAALTPPPVEEDDLSKPLVVPASIKVAMVLTLLGGVIYLFVGGVNVIQRSDYLEQVRVSYNDQVAKCQEVGGVGDAVTTTPTDAQKELVDTCSKLRVATEADFDALSTQIVVFGLVFLAMGLASLVAGWFLRTGVVWARWVLVGVVAISFILTMLFQVAGALTLGALLLLGIAMVLTFIGKGGLFISRARERRKLA